MTRRCPEKRGFTLVEASICVVLVGVMLVASTGTFGALARIRRQQIESREAMLIAQQLMAEIQRSYFVDPGTPGSSRVTFNCIDDYNGYSASPPVSSTGTALAGYTGWRESVATACVSPTSPGTTVASSALKRITITIKAPSNKSYTLVGLRSQYGPYETVPATVTNYLTGTTITLQGALPAAPVYAGAHPLNISTSQ